MTRVDDVNECLRIVYGQSYKDLTAEGYEKHIGALRNTDPTLARRVERALDPFLARNIFPRRKIKWQQTPEGKRLRLLLLPDNPHLKQDVTTIRSVLGIPQDQVKARKDSPEWEEMSPWVKPSRVGKVIEINKAIAWRVIHCQAAKNLEMDPELLKCYPDDLVQSAVSSSRIDFKGIDFPEWLKLPSRADGRTGSIAPIDWAANCLIERYSLPGHIALPLVLYILTENSSFLQDLEPLEVEVTAGNAEEDREAFTVIIRNIDEFVSKEDWERIWEKMIQPRQDHLWSQRGRKPQGRRTADEKRLNKFLPVYENMIAEKKTIPQILADPSLSGNLDQETIRRGLKDLSELLKPAQTPCK